MNAIREALSLIKNDRKTFTLINLGYFATVIIGMLIIRSNPEL
jgi:hypothetical protein